MKQYLKNLIMAIRGDNPFQEEVDLWRERCDSASDNVSKQWDQIIALNVELSTCRDKLKEYNRSVKKFDDLLKEAEWKIKGCHMRMVDLHKCLDKKDEIID